jgi:hypothetical protein
MKAKPRDSCIEMFRKLGILTLYMQYILSTVMFVVKYKDIFTINTELHKINIRHKLDFHVPLPSLTEVQKGVYYSGITLFNALPHNIKQAVHDNSQFKNKFKTFLIDNSFYSVEEYLHMKTGTK